ncbi:baseplate J/gp47 family protein [Neisseria sp. S1]|uniref:baseplate J/gp47 family protein n=1 Tax=Neisseria sp. S1 TaxID=3318354 RepID=UPI003A83DB83
MFEIPTFEQIRASILRDTQSLDPTADISPDSDHYVHASRLASVAVGQYAHQAWIVRQIFPDTADSEYLERHANLRGLKRRNATTAAGYADISGTAGAEIAAGLLIKRGDYLYRTLSTAVVGHGGMVQIPIAALDNGTVTHAKAAAAQFMAAPAGVQSECVITVEGGTDAESDAALLDRLLERIRRPAAGGNKYDFKNWALNVDGVTSAYVYPLRRGEGTVDIVITSSGGMPSEDTIKKCQDYIDEVRPVTARNVLVMAPISVEVDVTASVYIPGVADVQSPVERALEEHFAKIEPGDDVVVSQIEAVISNVAGVSDRHLTAPAANLLATNNDDVRWYRLGRVTINRMG